MLAELAQGLVLLARTYTPISILPRSTTTTTLPSWAAPTSNVEDVDVYYTFEDETDGGLAYDHVGHGTCVDDGDCDAGETCRSSECYIDLTQGSASGNITRDGTTYKEGSASALFTQANAQYFYAAYSSLLVPTTRDLTACCWAYPLTDVTGYMLNKRSSTSGGWGLQRSSTSTRQRSLFTDGSVSPVVDYIAARDAGSPTTTWTYACIQYKAADTTTEVKTIVDALTIETANDLSASGWTNGSTSFRIGASSGGGTSWNGNLDACWVDLDATWSTPCIGRDLNCGLDMSLCMCAYGSDTYLGCTVDSDCRKGTNTTALCSGGKCLGRGVVAEGSSATCKAACP